MGIGMVALVVAGVVLVVYLVRALQAPATHAVAGSQPQAYASPAVLPQQMPAAPAPQAPAAPAETPKDVVQRRYAAGEIDRDEYLQKLADL